MLHTDKIAETLLKWYQEIEKIKEKDLFACCIIIKYLFITILLNLFPKIYKNCEKLYEK